MSSFRELKLAARLVRSIEASGYSVPTPIQQQSIPWILQGRDVLACAQTGTGKTAAFALPMLQRLGRDPRKSRSGAPRGLVLVPTRELAIQVCERLRVYGESLRLRYAVVYGGVSQTRQMRVINKGVHVLVATPGRLLDLIGQGLLSLDHLEMFVLDEVDRMLDMGFLPDLKRVIAELPENRQSLFFSATLPKRVSRISESMLEDPVRVSVTPDNRAAELVEHEVMFVERHQKRERLSRLLCQRKEDRVMVFTRTKRGADVLGSQLKRDGIPCAVLHGDKSQKIRQQTLGDFRSRKTSVLVATDVAARGLDIFDVGLVVNFELPVDPENYVHRIGRTGRAGKTGQAISFCESGEQKGLDAIEKFLGQKIPVATDSGKPARKKTLSVRKTTTKDSKLAAGTGSPSKQRKRRYRRRSRRLQQEKASAKSIGSS